MNGTVKRTIFGVLFLAVMLGGLLFYEFLYTVLFAFITYVMLKEFYRMTMGKAYEQSQRSAVVMGVIFFLTTNSYFFGSFKLPMLVSFGIIMLLLLMAESIFLYKENSDFLKTGYLYAGLLYIGLPLALSNAVVCRDGEFSGLLMVAFFCIIWASDV